MATHIRDTLVEMYRRGIIKFGEYKLASGKKSPFYIDLRELPLYPELYRGIMISIASEISGLKYDIIAGIETAGIIHAGYLSCLLNKPVTYVRKKPKSHGTKRLVEADVKDKIVIIIDDVITTGGTISSAINAVRAAGGIVTDVFVIIDRCEGGRQKLSSLGVKLHSYANVFDIVNSLEDLIDPETYNVVIKYIEKNVENK